MLPPGDFPICFRLGRRVKQVLMNYWGFWIDWWSPLRGSFFQISLFLLLFLLPVHLILDLLHSLVNQLGLGILKTLIFLSFDCHDPRFLGLILLYFPLILFGLWAYLLFQLIEWPHILLILAVESDANTLLRIFLLFEGGLLFGKIVFINVCSLGQKGHEIGVSLRFLRKVVYFRLGEYLRLRLFLGCFLGGLWKHVLQKWGESFLACFWWHFLRDLF